MQHTITIDTLIRGTDLLDVVRRSGVVLSSHGSRYVGNCPFCSDKTGKFSVSGQAGSWSYQCDACKEEGDALSFVQRRYHLDFVSSIKHLQGGAQAVSRGVVDPDRAKKIRYHTQKEKEKLREIAAKRQRAFNIYWQSPEFCAGLVRYLAELGIAVDGLGGKPSSLRLSPALNHPCGAVLPAMVAEITDVGGKFLGIQRTWLTPDGKHIADVSPCRMMLGMTTGGCIKLYPAKKSVVIAISVETALEIRRVRPDVAVWAAGSWQNLPSIILPSGIERVVIAIDGRVPVTDADAARYRDVIVAATQSWEGQIKNIKVRTLSMINPAKIASELDGFVGDSGSVAAPVSGYLCGQGVAR